MTTPLDNQPTKNNKLTNAVETLISSPEAAAAQSAHQLVVYYGPNHLPQYVDCALGFDRVQEIVETLAELYDYKFSHWSEFQPRYFDEYLTKLTGVFVSEPHYSSIDVGAVKDLINNHSEWPALQKALIDLLGQHKVSIEATLQHQMDLLTDYGKALGGSGGFRLIKLGADKKDLDLTSPLNRAFDDEATALRYMLENISQHHGIVIGDANIAKFIKNEGDALFQALIPAAQRKAYIKEMCSLAKDERWMLPRAFAAVYANGREN